LNVDWATIITAVITAGFAFLGVYTSNRRQTALVAYRLEKLEIKVDKHNNVVERMYRLMDGQAEALEFTAEVGDPYIHVPLKDLHVISDALIAVIVRDGQVMVPFGNDTIEVGDCVVVISRRKGLSTLGEVFR
jgi:trk system potassium uptake protein TrkA